MPVNLFPRADVDLNDLRSLRVKSAEVAQALVAGVNGISSLIYRQFRPTDTSLNGTVPTGHLTNPAAWVPNVYSANMFPNFQTKQNQAFALYGIVLHADAPKLDEISISVGANPVAIFPLNQIQSPAAGTAPQEGVWFDPIWVPPSTAVAVTALSYAGQTITAELFDFIGVVAEKAGDNINPQSVLLPTDSVIQATQADLAALGRGVIPGLG